MDTETEATTESTEESTQAPAESPVTTTENSEVTMETPAEFPITINEFVAGTKPIGSAKAFLNTIRAEGDAMPKLRGEWQALFALFMSKPIDIKWKEWKTTNQGGRK